MLVKSGLVGVQKGCGVIRGKVETIRLHLAGGVLQPARVVLGSGPVQGKFRLLVVHQHV